MAAAVPVAPRRGRPAATLVSAVEHAIERVQHRIHDQRKPPTSGREDGTAPALDPLAQVELPVGLRSMSPDLLEFLKSKMFLNFARLAIQIAHGVAHLVDDRSLEFHQRVFATPKLLRLNEQLDDLAWYTRLYEALCAWNPKAMQDMAECFAQVVLTCSHFEAPGADQQFFEGLTAVVLEVADLHVAWQEVKPVVRQVLVFLFLGPSRCIRAAAEEERRAASRTAKQKQGPKDSDPATAAAGHGNKAPLHRHGHGAAGPAVTFALQKKSATARRFAKTRHLLTSMGGALKRRRGARAAALSPKQLAAMVQHTRPPKPRGDAQRTQDGASTVPQGVAEDSSSDGVAGALSTRADDTWSRMGVGAERPLLAAHASPAGKPGGGYMFRNEQAVTEAYQAARLAILRRDKAQGSMCAEARAQARERVAEHVGPRAWARTMVTAEKNLREAEAVRREAVAKRTKAIEDANVAPRPRLEVHLDHSRTRVSPLIAAVSPRRSLVVSCQPGDDSPRVQAPETCAIKSPAPPPGRPRSARFRESAPTGAGSQRKTGFLVTPRFRHGQEDAFDRLQGILACGD